jgi:selenocysteine lyase/cysteine desulfurase
MNLETYFEKFRNNIIGLNQDFVSPSGEKRKIVYADWTASGRCYLPIEDTLQKQIMPFVANTHTDTNITGKGLTYAYHLAQKMIKKHVNASDQDVLISAYSGMTGVVNKFQRILGLKIHERFANQVSPALEDRPIVFITHMEHHSNQTSWLETIADVVVVEPDVDGLFSLGNFEKLLQEHQHRKLKIAAITSCSNVTGIFTPYHQIAKMIHQAGGLCFVDFACCAPYVNINMHPADKEESLDAIYFSPHKFLGGPGTAGVLIFNKALYHNKIPDNAGGGTVEWTNPWGGRRYYEDIETREDGGTPAFLQTIKTALCINLKEEMGVENILKREEEQLQILFEKLSPVKNLHILAKNHQHRLGIISFYIEDLHFNVGVKILNDKFGIQTRGGCSCAGTYSHYLLNVQPKQSAHITQMIDAGNYAEKPGWIRASIHPTTSNKEIAFLADSIVALANNHQEWVKEYQFNSHTNSVSCLDVGSDQFIISHMDKAMGLSKS